MKTHTNSTKQRLARLYARVIGYNPFDDDPTATPADVLAILKDYREEVRAQRAIRAGVAS